MSLSLRFKNKIFLTQRKQLKSDLSFSLNIIKLSKMIKPINNFANRWKRIIWNDIENIIKIFNSILIKWISLQYVEGLHS